MRVLEPIPYFHNKIILIIFGNNLKDETFFIGQSEAYPQGIEVKTTKKVIVLDEKLKEKISNLQGDNEFNSLVISAGDYLDKRYIVSCQKDEAAYNLMDSRFKEKAKLVADRLGLEFAG
jgi:hypothetical protein